MKKALITGITGQDGSYLAEILLREGYEVHGTIRRASNFNTQRIEHIREDKSLHLHFADLADVNSMINLFHAVKPDEVYNLASMSHVKVSFEIPEYTAQVTGIAPVRMLEWLRVYMPEVKFYQASSSEMYGTTPAPQSEDSPMLPVSPYGCAKLYAYHMTNYYREAYKMFACTGILFNHESARRGHTFVTQKIVQAAYNIKAGRQFKIHLGNLDALRDWGHAQEYMEAAYRIMQRGAPEVFVIATGMSHKVREFAERTFRWFGLNLYDYLERDKEYLRPIEVADLRGDVAKAERVLGWRATKRLDDIIDEMCTVASQIMN